MDACSNKLTRQIVSFQMHVHKLTCCLEELTSDAFQLQIGSVENFNIRKSLKQIHRQLTQCGIDKSNALVGQHIAIGGIDKLRFIIRNNILKETRQLFATLIGNVPQLADIKIAASQIDV